MPGPGRLAIGVNPGVHLAGGRWNPGYKILFTSPPPPEIAAELFVSEGTVKTHINHVFTKLQLRDRAAAVVFAFDHDLVARD